MVHGSLTSIMLGVSVLMFLSSCILRVRPGFRMLSNSHTIDSFPFPRDACLCPFLSLPMDPVRIYLTHRSNGVLQTHAHNVLSSNRCRVVGVATCFISLPERLLSDPFSNWHSECTCTPKPRQRDHSAALGVHREHVGAGEHYRALRRCHL